MYSGKCIDWLLPRYLKETMDIDEIAKKIANGNRRALARAITLVESARSDHREQSALLLEAASGIGRQAIRIGLSGTPGAGKSTFIESFGMMLVKNGLKVAVIAVDPSSTRSGGSILGDKTRMERLSREPNAFIRPSPSQSYLGGVTRRSWEVVALCEAAGFDIVLVETVGVGQSETLVAEMTDIFSLLLAPAGGDELQGVKRGIMEIADIILVNKADGDLKSEAARTCADYSGALRLLRKRPQDPENHPKAIAVSALFEEKLDVAWNEMRSIVDWRKSEGHFELRRKRQAQYWFEEEVRFSLLKMLKTPELRAAMKDGAKSVANGTNTPIAAARKVIDMLYSRKLDI